MDKIGLVMDSTGYLSLDLIEKFQIKIVPLNVTIGNETFPETEISNQEFFARLNKTGGTSTTSQPSVGTFLETYEQLFAGGAESIISLHISRALSGTITAAEMAREMSSKTNIYIVDSGSSALSLGLLAWAAAEWCNEGLPAAEIVKKVEELKDKTELYFIVDTLEYLRRGGRIGGGAALIGTFLQIKPILYTTKEGHIDVFDKVRTKAKAWESVRELLAKALAHGLPYRICVQHVGIPDVGEKIAGELREQYPEHEIKVFEAGPVIATHVGPGAFGLSFQPKPLLK